MLTAAFVVSLLLIAGGAVLVWGVTATARGLDLDVIGVILLVAGIAGMTLAWIAFLSWPWRVTPPDSAMRPHRSAGGPPRPRGR